MRNLNRLLINLSWAVLIVGGIAGCGSSSDMTESQRQDAILQDPMNYKPDIGRDATDDTGEFDKAGFDTDLKNVLGP